MLARLDMDVGRAHLDGAGDELVGEADDRRAACEILQPLDIVLRVGGRRGAVGFDRPARDGVEPLMRRVDVGQSGDARLDALLGAQLDGADRHLVERIGHREGDRLRPVGERQHLGMAQEIAAQHLLQRGLLGKLGGVGDGDAEPLGQRLGHLALGDEAELREQRQEMLVAGAAQAQRPVEPGRGELAAGDERLADGEFDRGPCGENRRFLHDRATISHRPRQAKHEGAVPAITC